MKKLTLIKPKGIVFDLDGKEYTFVLDFNAFAELEREFGSIQGAFSKLSESVQVGDALKILRAGMASNKEVPSEALLGSFITIENMPQILEAINDAFTEAMPPEPETKKAKN